MDESTLSEHFQSIARIRPLTSFSRSIKALPFQCSSHSIRIGQQTFQFDHLHPQHSSQQDVYRHLVPKIRAAIEGGYNWTILATGAVASGKSYTMIGKRNQEGIVACFLKQVVNWPVEGDIFISVFQLYKDKIIDLTNPHQRELQLHQSPSEGVYIQNLNQYILESDTVNHILQLAQKHRKVRPVQQNARSNSSHVIYQVLIEKVIKQGGECEYHRHKLTFIDLAGYSSFQITDDVEEGRHINKSLTALGRLIGCIVHKEHPAYRQTLLTSVLKDCINQHSESTILVCFSPLQSFLRESLLIMRSFLQFKNIKASIKSQKLSMPPAQGSVIEPALEVKKIVRKKSPPRVKKEQSQVMRRLRVLEGLREKYRERLDVELRQLRQNAHKSQASRKTRKSETEDLKRKRSFLQ